MIQKTYLPSVKDVEKQREWHFINADNKILGRLASEAANLLMGKHRKYYTPNMDCGDFVVITNCDKIKVTGNKAEDKFYFRHSGYAKGAKTIPYKRQMENDSTKIIFLAIKRMLSPNRLRDKRLKRLKLYKLEQQDFKVNHKE